MTDVSDLLYTKLSVFKQKTAYDFLSGLVGSEKCIRDGSLFRPPLRLAPNEIQRGSMPRSLPVKSSNSQARIVALRNLQTLNFRSIPRRTLPSKRSPNSSSFSGVPDRTVKTD